MEPLGIWRHAGGVGGPVRLHQSSARPPRRRHVCRSIHCQRHSSQKVARSAIICHLLESAPLDGDCVLGKVLWNRQRSWPFSPQLRLNDEPGESDM